MWTYWIVLTRTGARQLQVFSSKAPWSRMLNDGGKGSTMFQLGVPTFPVDYDTYTQPWKYSIVYCWNGAPIYWGVITGRRWSRARRQLTVRHSDIRFLLTRRYPFGASSYWADEPNHLPGSLTITNKSLRAIAGKVVEQGCIGPSAIYSLPIVLPSLTEVGTHSRTYQNYHFRTVADILKELQDIEGGPDIDFEPRDAAGGGFELLMRTGAPAPNERISGSVFDFVMTSSHPRLHEVEYDEDGTDQLTGQFGIGEGSERDMRVGGDGVGAGATIPALDAAEYYKLEASEPILAAYGTAAVATNGGPTKQWEYSFLATEEPGLQNLRMGSILRLHWDGDPDRPDGWVNTRLISMSGTESHDVVLDVQTMG